ncbi:hypothetical protein CIB48_g5727 [Xylaria polymorpha]|nr:hypothetical protein CIB48_g5727 [Xylaria polymorpha]
MRVRHRTTAWITRFASNTDSRASTTAAITGLVISGGRTSRAQQQQRQRQRQRRPPLQPRTIASATTLQPSRQRHPLTTRAMSTSPGAAPPPSPSPSPSPSTSATEPDEPKQLPPLSAAEFREYNRLAEQMDAFHAHFRSTWETLYTSASSGRRTQGLSIRAFIKLGLDFVSHLETHHAIEERYVFPELARRMPEFRTGKERDLPAAAAPEGKKKREAAELLRQHVEIHHGMDGLRAYLKACLAGETELQMSALKAQLDTWGAVLWAHLDQEVKTLGAENMRRYWSLDDIRKLRM